MLIGVSLGLGETEAEKGKDAYTSQDLSQALKICH